MAPLRAVNDAVDLGLLNLADPVLLAAAVILYVG